MSSAPDLRSSSAPADAVLGFFREMTMASAPRVVIEGGGGPARADIVCGFLGCDVRPFNPVLASLPRLVHLRSTSAVKGPDRLAQLIEFALAESREGTSGAKCVLLHLSEILFVEVVRQYLETLTAGHTGWLAGLRDPLVGHALARLHDRPADSWTLERLAREVGTSRSALADRFTHLVGQPPMRYLTQWRLQLAARMLSDGAAKVSAVAQDVGYESEAAFSRAFKKSRRNLTCSLAPAVDGHGRPFNAERCEHFSDNRSLSNGVPFRHRLPVADRCRLCLQWRHFTSNRNTQQGGRW